jgi:hypothetical protein
MTKTITEAKPQFCDIVHLAGKGKSTHYTAQKTGGLCGSIPARFSATDGAVAQARWARPAESERAAQAHDFPTHPGRPEVSLALDASAAVALHFADERRAFETMEDRLAEGKEAFTAPNFLSRSDGSPAPGDSRGPHHRRGCASLAERFG